MNNKKTIGDVIDEISVKRYEVFKDIIGDCMEGVILSVDEAITEYKHRCETLKLGEYVDDELKVLSFLSREAIWSRRGSVKDVEQKGWV